MSLPWLLKIVGTHRSHHEAGGQDADLIACRSVANDVPILRRLFALLVGACMRCFVVRNDGVY